MSRPKKVSDALLIDSLKRCGGIYTDTAKFLEKEYGIKVDRSTISKRIAKSERMKKAYHEIEETTLDMVEGKLMQAIKQGNITAIIFFLKCKGKDRNYNQRFEVTGKDGSPVKATIETYKILLPDNHRD